MKKKRRKLSKDFEKKIASSLKEMELILAKINDIDDDDIRGEYAIAFAPIKSMINIISSEYIQYGFLDTSEGLYLNYFSALGKFKDEYEI